MRYVFFVNPTAGKGTAQQDIISEIDRYFAENAEEYRIHITRFKGDAQQSARAEAQTGDELTIFACGGEGTCFEVINGVTGFKNVSVGVIPCGSANDFLKFFGSSEPFLDMNAQISGERVEMDLIKAGEHYCLNGCSVGMDAMVAEYMHLFKKWPLVSGKLAYNLAIVKTFLRKLGITIRISMDDEKPKEKRCLFAVVANAPFYGGGYMSAPTAVPYDGKLDFTVVDVISRIRVPKFLSCYSKGTHTNLDYCTLKTCKSMEFTADKPIPVNLDGEIIVTDKMHFEIVPKAISFVVPRVFSEKILINV